MLNASLTLKSPSELTLITEPVPSTILKQVAELIDEVRLGGEVALREISLRLGDLKSLDAPLMINRESLALAYRSLSPEAQGVLERTAERIRAFARAQRACLTELSIAIPGGTAGHTLAPVDAAGCYAPGGRFPLPSSVLMTAITAREAGVKEVTVASPRPTPVTLAAAYVAGADQLLAVGGAQAIAAMAYGIGAPAVDVIVGPGNHYVTAAKQLVSGVVRIDMLAGPSELVILADHEADPALIAADLIGQAEHDPEARPILVTTDLAIIERVNQELAVQLEALPTREVAARALASHGVAVYCDSLDEAISVCDRLAPEHLELMLFNADEVAPRLNHYGGLFIGSQSAEVFGDYGLGPNHVLPTGGAARLKGGLSVFDFLRVRTWMQLDRRAQRSTEFIRDVGALARLEGLEGHARSAERRLFVSSSDSETAQLDQISPPQSDLSE